MVIEYGMYFALGFLAAALIAIAVGPAFWRRAVRLTKRRIEAATPVTLSEFRADKDRLRADFAISLRKREIRIDALREQLAAKVVALDAARTELSALQSERDEQYGAIEAFKLRDEELVARIRDLERDSASLAAQLRQPEAQGDIDPALLADESEPVDADRLSGDYRSDVEDLLTALSIERQRNGYLEEQARMLLTRLESRKKSGRKDEAIAMLRDTLSAQTDPESEARVQLRKAEARISGAESRLNALLAESGGEGNGAGDRAGQRLLAEDFSRTEREAEVREAVADLQQAIGADWATERFDADSLRARLQSIAGDVSSLVYAEDAEEPSSMAESLFDRVSKFAGDGGPVEHLSVATPQPGGAVANRMDALRDRLA